MKKIFICHADLEADDLLHLFGKAIFSFPAESAVDVRAVTDPLPQCLTLVALAC